MEDPEPPQNQTARGHASEMTCFSLTVSNISSISVFYNFILKYHWSLATKRNELGDKIECSLNA